ncbi:MAG: hypothetical protein UR12_C0001G0017 [candidate division TM6 bacterium GW2011_GWF2_30_66]|nr:MAG: hypothetical protein UR12_C0001G0017 [candidate division TM6 bacterium GW2011_GWF2_30_66]
MKYTNKLITLTMLCSVFTQTSFTCDRCEELKATYKSTITDELTKSSEIVSCSCSHPKPAAKPPVKVEETVDCSCSRPPRPPKPATKSGEIVSCSCSHPKPAAKPPVKAEETVDCSCSKPPKPTRPTTKSEEVCPYAEVEEVITQLSEKIISLKKILESAQAGEQEIVAMITKDLDTIADTLEDISNSELTPEQAMEELIKIKKIIDEIEYYINAK